MSPKLNEARSVPHDSAVTHVTGASVFIDDRRMLKGEVHVGLVLTQVASGELLSIDASLALQHPDCLGVLTAKDFAHHHWGTIKHDQPFLVVKEIGYLGEAAAIVVSRDRSSLATLIKKVKLNVLEKPGVFSIDEAIEKNSILYRAATPFVQGDIEHARKQAKHVLSGTVSCGGQEHFYMESQAAIAYPLENGQIEVHSSSQHPSETQRVVAEALGLSLHQVVCVVKRMGGGFGGKESQAAPIAAYAALVAKTFNRPARIVLTKDEDMVLTGKRHPFQNDYEVGFNDDGKIEFAKVTLRSDGGAYLDLSSSILERAMFHFDGAYYLPNVWIDGICYRTNYHSNTAFRGFGGPQGTFTIESIIEDIAAHLGRDAAEIRRINLYRGKNVKTPYGQEVENNMLPEIFDKICSSSEYERRLKEIERFNQTSKGVLRGISLTATKFGIAFTARFLNQGNALVNLHLDGTVQVSTGATEMGQGVNTKIQQHVADAFGIESSAVNVMPTSTEKNHNTSPTAASSGADINVAAALKACNQIKSNLIGLYKQVLLSHPISPLKEYEVRPLSDQDFGLDEHLLDPDFEFSGSLVTQKSTGKQIPLKELISIAYLNRISLGAYAHFKTKGLGFDKATVTGRAFNYFTQGMAVTEVELNCFTGECKVLRTDILMDLGRSLNPGIDRGQVIGAYVQALGWMTTEKLVYNEKHALLSHSPTTYKIPNVQDIPRELHVHFIENKEVTNNVRGSKAVGEPPFLLGISAFTAIKHALSFSKNGERKVVCMNAPATSENILLTHEGLR